MKNNKTSMFGAGVVKKYQKPPKWAFKVGVFKTPQRKWIVRIKLGENKRATTISQHDTEQEALNKYNKIK